MVNIDSLDESGDLTTVEGAKQYAKASQQKVDAILFSMSEEDLQREVYISTGGRTPIWKAILNAYVVHLKKRDELYKYIFALRKDLPA